MAFESPGIHIVPGNALCLLFKYGRAKTEIHLESEVLLPISISAKFCISYFYLDHILQLGNGATTGTGYIVENPEDCSYNVCKGDSNRF